jgi:CheY-like chemotaxis protein
MEAIGQLSGGIAHDFNNILAAIIGNVQLALEDIEPSHAAVENLEEIAKSARRAKNLVQQILTFARQNPAERRLIAPSAIAEDSVRLLRATIPAGVELALRYADDVPDVLADPTQLEQVIVNLCTNAWHALEGEKGRIDVQLKSVVLNDATARALSCPRSGQHAQISVRDTGKGMDGATVQRIFEPFFTTKTPDRGTGLGLSVVHGIVKSHEGAISVKSALHSGTTFDVYLPSAAAHQGRYSTVIPRLERGHGEEVLYLDDDPALVRVTRRTLERLGYHVTTCTTAALALEMFLSNPRRFALVITDLNMPEFSGIELAAQLLKVRADVPIILTSGYITEDVKAAALETGIRTVVHKPNTAEELSQAIRGVLDHARAG